jgi:hypothetical protein
LKPLFIHGPFTEINHHGTDQLENATNKEQGTHRTRRMAIRFLPKQIHASS